MNILDIFRRKPKAKPQTNGFRNYNGADLSRLTSDWLASNTSADAEMRGNLKILRSRCREMERNSDYARRYFKLVINNVLGHSGVGLQMKVRERVKKKDKWVQRYDTLANNIVEDAFHAWSQARYCTIGKQHTWVDVQKLALRSVARDGAVLVRKHYPREHPHKFAIELLEIDQLDDDYNATHADMSVTRLGVRRAKDGRVIGYWILTDHPGDLYQMRSNGKYSSFVEANRIIHLYDPERVGQTTGVPWLISSMVRLRNLTAYEEAEVVAARISAAKMGFLVPNETANSEYSGAEDGKGNKYMEVEPGSIEQLPRGFDFKAFDPSHPSTAFKDFVKATLRGISGGLGVSYTSLANDLESVNYSSIRAGLLEEREEWKTVQQWFISWFIRPVFEEWLMSAAVAGALKNSEGGPTLPASKFDKWNQPEFKPRRWPWVDPLNDLQAAVLSVDKGFNSRRQIISEGGGDIEDTFADIEADEDLAEQHGLDFASDSKMQANAQQEKPDAPDSVALTEEKD